MQVIGHTDRDRPYMVSYYTKQLTMLRCIGILLLVYMQVACQRCIVLEDFDWHTFLASAPIKLMVSRSIGHLLGGHMWASLPCLAGFSMCGQST